MKFFTVACRDVKYGVKESYTRRLISTGLRSSVGVARDRARNLYCRDGQCRPSCQLGRQISYFAAPVFVTERLICMIFDQNI